MKRCLVLFLLLIATPFLALQARGETEQIDLKALAKKARPAVMLLVVSDADGKEIATGTGFLVSSDGKLITNHHVIEGAASAVAKAENGGLFPVEGVLADDSKDDLVLLKLKGRDLPFLPLGSSDKIEVGSRIAVIGSPLGLEGTLSEGIVSAVRELMGDARIVQITAAISPGSSGSPVLNMQGEVIGVAVSVLKGGQSLNFAVPVESVKRVLPRLGTIKLLSELSKEAVQELEADPDYKACVSAHLAGDYVEALKRDKVLVNRFPNNPRVWNGLGGTYYMLEFYADAVEAFRQSIKLKPDYEASWQCLGVAYLALQKYAEAVAALQQSIKLKPDDPSAWYFMGLTYIQSGQHEKALGIVPQLEKLDPKRARELAEALR
ncbi:MAG TPA: trypsin-like peptidase domain-containing protein [Verrucomicrobiae bacterium]|nr:trypsin-like peptidase domain-containing protein [Verrucomicrobiae bacterium]